MSRAFVREEDEDLSNLRYGAEYRRKREDWLRIQEKKRDFLLKDPKAAALDPATRQKWLQDTEEDIRRTREELGLEVPQGEER